MDFILANIPMLICLLAGIALIIVEVFMPGFGLPGLSGLALLIAGVAMLWIRVGALAALGVVVIVVALLAILLSISLKSASSGTLSKSALILRTDEKTDAGDAANTDMNVLVGRSGMTHSVLRPAGIADFDGVRLNVVSEGDFISANVEVYIDHIEGSRIVVKTL
ncbi:MAG: NfeD family protein [Clostridia bacterium]